MPVSADSSDGVHSGRCSPTSTAKDIRVKDIELDTRQDIQQDLHVSLNVFVDNFNCIKTSTKTSRKTINAEKCRKVL